MQLPMPVEVQMALGRIFALMSRPGQPGDIERYEAARCVVLDYADNISADYRPNYARDRMCGAAGD